MSCGLGHLISYRSVTNFILCLDEIVLACMGRFGHIIISLQSLKSKRGRHAKREVDMQAEKRRRVSSRRRSTGCFVGVQSFLSW